MAHRRTFLKQTAALSAATYLSTTPLWAAKANSANDKLQVALIGVGLRGTNHLENLLLRSDVAVTAICDIDASRIQIALKLIEDAKQKKPAVYGADEKDYVNLLARKDVDAVIIATPWLWHTRMAVDAMEAGKYAGVEVSAANTLEE